MCNIKNFRRSKTYHIRRTFIRLRLTEIIYERDYYYLSRACKNTILNKTINEDCDKIKDFMMNLAICSLLVTEEEAEDDNANSILIVNLWN